MTDSIAPIGLLIVDDHPVVREGIAGMFAAQPGRFRVLGTAADGAEGVQQAAALSPDVVLMDLQMPVLDGVRAMQQILAAQPTIRVLVLTTYATDADIAAALDAGATGYLLKDTPRDALYEAVEAAARGQPRMSARVVEHLMAQRSADALTEREREVLRLAAQGHTNKAIGKVLHISEATVKTHLKHIYSKLNVPDRASAVATALQRGLIRLDSDQP